MFTCVFIDFITPIARQNIPLKFLLSSKDKNIQSVHLMHHFL